MCDKYTHLSFNREPALRSLPGFSLPSFVGVAARNQEGSFLPVGLRCLLFHGGATAACSSLDLLLLGYPWSS